MDRKQSAISFLKLTGLGNVKDAYHKHVSADFIHHNQYFEGTRDALEKAMIEAHKTSPNKSIEIKHIYQDGDTVITNSQVIKENMEIVVIHIFRFEGDKIAELWDVGQEIMKDSLNKNGLF